MRSGISFPLVLLLSSAGLLSHALPFNETIAVLPRDSSVIVTLQDAPWYLARIAQGLALNFGGHAPVATALQDYNWNFRRNDQWGTNVFVYVVDTGVRSTHQQFLAGRVLAGMTIPTIAGPATVDTANHGTGVASIIAGINTGVAKLATIIPVKVAVDNPEIASTTADVTTGINMARLDFIQRKQANPNVKAVINISMIVRSSAAAAQAITDAIGQGMHVVIAAGNDGKNQCPGQTPPAADERVANVGQFTVSSTFFDDSWIHNYGNCVDLVAPGHSLYVSSSAADNAYTSAIGTSFAAPLLSGVIAGILSDSAVPITPAQMKTLVLANYVTNGVVTNVPAGSFNRMLRSPLQNTVQR